MSVLHASRCVLLIESRMILNNPCGIIKPFIEVGLTNLQSVRWRKTPHRKPIWMPRAPTKLFRIPVHPVVPEDEADEHNRLFLEYVTKMQSITKYFMSEYHASSAEGELTRLLKEEDEKKFEELLRMNDAENRRVAALREERFRLRLQEKEEEALRKVVDMEEWMKKKQEEIEALVKLEKERSKTYITVEKLDSAIEEVLDDVVNYNFAIDLDGKVYWENDFPHPQETATYESASNEAARKV